MRVINSILIIDDESSIRSMLRIFLENKNYCVFEAENGQIGIDIFDRESPDLVIPDIKMPIKDGIEVLKYIFLKKSMTEVIILTGHGDIELAIKAIKLRAGDFLTKPFSTKQLDRAIARVEARYEANKKTYELKNDLDNRVVKAVSEIQESYEFQDALVSNTLNAIICFDNDRTVTMFNKWAEHITGYSEKEITTFDFFTLFPEAESKIAKENLFEKNKDLKWIETFLKNKDGDSIPIKFSGTILYKRDGHSVLGIVVFLHDLRDIKKLEYDLEQASRFAIIGETVSGLAHCIKNILIGLEGSLYVVNKGLRKENFEKINKGWFMVENNIKRISDLSLQLLTFSKKREPEYEFCNPALIVKDVCDLLENKSKEKNVKIVQKIQMDIKKHSLDKIAIHRCLLNLVTNSIDALNDKKDGKGKIEVSVKHDNNFG